MKKCLIILAVLLLVASFGSGQLLVSTVPDVEPVMVADPSPEPDPFGVLLADPSPEPDPFGV